MAAEQLAEEAEEEEVAEAAAEEAVEESLAVKEVGGRVARAGKVAREAKPDFGGTSLLRSFSEAVKRELCTITACITLRTRSSVRAFL